MIVKTITTTRNYEAVFVDGQNPAFVWGQFKEIREKGGMQTKPFESCFACDHKFLDDENIFVCSIKSVGNRFLCKNCAEKYDTAGKDGTK